MNPPNPPTPGHDITRRNFMKKSALTVGAVAVLSQGTSWANNLSSNCKKTVKVKRVWSVTSNGELAAGTGQDPQERIAYAHAIQAMMDKMESDGNLTRQLVDSENASVPCHYILKNVFTHGEEEDPPGPIEIEDHLHLPPAEQGGNHSWAVVGSLPASATEVTMRWEWGEP